MVWSDEPWAIAAERHGRIVSSSRIANFSYPGSANT